MMKLNITRLSFVVLALLGTLLQVSAQSDVRQRQVAPTPTPSVIATPMATPAAQPSGLQSLADLQSKIRLRLARPEVRRGQVGIKIVSLNSGKSVFEENAEKYFMPASNMKNFTVAAALERLTPDFRFVTSVYAAAMPDPSGTINGDLRIYGRGDVSISNAFNSGDYFKGLDNLADKIVQAGVKKIEGGLVGDESYFAGNAIPGSWEIDDLQWYYGAEISALPLNDNAIELSVKPGPVGYQCSVRLVPINPIVRVVNRCMTASAGSRRDMRIVKNVGQNTLEITGSLPAGNAGFSGSVTFSRPADLFVALLKQRLELKGVTVTGQTRTVNVRNNIIPPTSVEIAKLESPPLSLIAAKTMKPSQNMYTETLLWTLGEEGRKLSPTPVQSDSADLGLAAVKSFLTGIGVAPDGIIQHDGSGLSRHNLITPSAVVQLYTYMSKQSRFASDWRNSLTIGGVDGTLANRFKGTAAAGNIRGKTGTIDQVSALSGYITTAGGDQLVLSIIVNGVNVTKDRTALIDEIVLNLANFNGKFDQ
ncbi:MAG: D-alanyl-D-alanine carboxypeptidase/D-alanyl-D-alanine-endopeptidase [Pyrinomonadaceae bacterium]